jgi:hypothetical protein
MKRDKEELLYSFCKEQHHKLSYDGWLNNSEFSKDELATVALFLTSQQWYGYKKELFELAELLHKGSVGNFAKMVKLTHFDCSRFAGMLEEVVEHA